MMLREKHIYSTAYISAPLAESESKDTLGWTRRSSLRNFRAARDPSTFLKLNSMHVVAFLYCGFDASIRRPQRILYIAWLYRRFSNEGRKWTDEMWQSGASSPTHTYNSRNTNYIARCANSFNKFNSWNEESACI